MIVSTTMTSTTTEAANDDRRFFSERETRERDHTREGPGRDRETTGLDRYKPRDELAQQHNTVLFAIVVVGCIQSGVVSSNTTPLLHPQWMQGLLGRCL